MRASIYPRISKEDQSAFSLEGQIEECKKYIEKEGYTLGEIYIEDGYSAKNMKRPALTRMLEDLAQKKFDIIVIWRLDRLTRSTLDGLNMVINLFRPKGVEFASVTEDIDTSTSDGMMMFTIRLSMAQNEREKIAERSSMGQKTRAKSGKRNSSAEPYGYNVGEGLQLSINEDEAYIVKQIYEWYLQGWGRIKIARTLNEKNIPAKKGGVWYEYIIGLILRNITYTGAVHWKAKDAPESERVIVPGVHDAIIPMDMFKQAQTVFKRRRENDMNLSSFDFIYSTIVKCAVCGRSYHGKMKDKDRNYRYYRCSGKYLPSQKCDASDIIEAKLTNLIFAHFESKDIVIDKTKPVVKKTLDTDRERKRIEKFLNESKEMVKRWNMAFGKGKMDYDDFSKLIDDERIKVKSWEEELSNLPQDEKNASHTYKDVADRFKRISMDWERMDNLERKSVIQNFFKAIYIGKVDKVWKIHGYVLPD
jgi:site-specific DNA recombinase